MYKLALALVATSALFAQTDRKFPFKYPKTTQQAQEIGTALRSLAVIENLTVSDVELGIKGTPAQLEFITWALPQLDLPPAPQAHATSLDFPFAGDRNDVVRIFRTGHSPSLQALNELATGLRSASWIRHLFTVGGSGSILLRGRPGDIDTAQWIFDQLDRATPPVHTETYTRTIPPDGTKDDQLNTFALVPAAHVHTLADFQEMTTAVRSITEVRSVFIYNPAHTLIVRATAAEIEMLTWLFYKLDQPATASPVPEYHAPAVNDGITILYLPASKSIDELHAEGVRVRRSTNNPRLFTYSRQRAIVVRGTASQLAEVRELVANENK